MENRSYSLGVDFKIERMQNSKGQGILATRQNTYNDFLRYQRVLGHHARISSILIEKKKLL